MTLTLCTNHLMFWRLNIINETNFGMHPVRALLKLKYNLEFPLDETINAIHLTGLLSCIPEGCFSPQNI
jgi:hypothetical protein